MVGLAVVLTAICEGPTFGFLHFTSHLYDQIYKGLTPLDIWWRLRCWLSASI